MMPKTVMTAIASAALLVAPAVSNAGFVTGLLVGSAMSNQSGSSIAQTQVIFAPGNHDVIACTTHDGVLCWRSNVGADTTPAQFAGRAGYRTLWKIGVAISGSDSYIIMEVSK